MTQLRQKFTDKHIIIILDNASIHKSKVVMAFLKRWEQIHLINLPPYSPEYNPVELMWKWIKPKIHGFCHQKNIQVIKERISKWLWKYNNGGLFRPINFKLKTYEQIL
jgi:transposase